MRDVPADHVDRLRWNAEYAGRRPAYSAHPLAERALSVPSPDGPVLDLACGPSGAALPAARVRTRRDSARMTHGRAYRGERTLAGAEPSRWA